MECWENIDFYNSGKELENNLLKLDYDDESVDVIYHSQFIEHLDNEQAKKFLKECKRILSKNGIMRIVTPDFENQVNEYLSLLKYLKNSNNSIDNNEFLKYQWIKLEILDQLTRNYSGGNMINFITKNKNKLSDYIINRLGRSGINIMKEDIVESNPFKKIIKKIFNSLFFFRSKYSSIGKFRLGGEIHYHIYDQIDLKNLLFKSGFKNINVVSYNKSAIPDWNSTLLDISDDKMHDSGNSIFMEASK